MPLIDNDNGPFKVRTLLDPGSGTNWIVKDLLQSVQYTKMGQELLEVVTFSGTIKKKFPLVEVYYQDDNGHKQNLMCYVYDVFTRHITVKGMPHYIITNAPNESPLFEKISDPASRDIDHGNQSQGIGIILCSTSINRLRTKTNILHIPELDILLEPTIFGVSISGAVPTCFKQNIEVVLANHIVPKLLR